MQASVPSEESPSLAERMRDMFFSIIGIMEKIEGKKSVFLAKVHDALNAATARAEKSVLGAKD